MGTSLSLITCTKAPNSQEWMESKQKHKTHKHKTHTIFLTGNSTNKKDFSNKNFGNNFNFNI